MKTAPVGGRPKAETFHLQMNWIAVILDGKPDRPQFPIFRGSDDYLRSAPCIVLLTSGSNLTYGPSHDGPL